MIALEDRLAGYLAVRRRLGYRLARAEKLLGQYIAWLNARGEQTITTVSALEWATLPPATESNWHAHRLSVVRGFAAHAHALDPSHELIAADLLPQRPRRAVPYLYTAAEIRALMGASSGTSIGSWAAGRDTSATETPPSSSTRSRSTLSTGCRSSSPTDMRATAGSGGGSLWSAPR